MQDASASYYLNNPRLAVYALGLEPAWLWRTDGTQALWANAAGAALFGATSVGDLTARQYEPSEPVAQQAIRLAQSLANDGAPRLERLRGFGVGLLLQPLICACSRLALDDETSAVLICGVEPIRPILSLADRVSRLLEGVDEALAAFTLAGDLVCATPRARQLMQSANNLAAIHATAPAAEAINAGQSVGSVPLGPISFWRIGRQADTLLVLRFNAAPQISATAHPARPTENVMVTPPQPQDANSAPGDIDNDKPETADVMQRDYAESVLQAVAKNRIITAVRRHPLRFVWELDADQHFTLTSEEFIAIAGSATAQINGAPWGEICATLGLDPRQQVANAIATRDTWSGIVLSWPTSKGDPIKVELSGLPIFDRQRRFTGYRGFGVCRDVAQIEQLAQRKPTESALPLFASAAAAEPSATVPEPNRPVLSLVPASANVVPFPAASPSIELRTPGLNAGERKAFSDIAQQLSARLKNSIQPEDSDRNNDQTPAIATPRSPPLPQYGSGIDGRAPVLPASEVTRADRIDWLAEGSDASVLLDRLPIGVLIYRAQELLFANRAFLDRLGYATLVEFSEGGGLDNLLLASAAERSTQSDAQTLSIATADHRQIEADARLISLPYGGDSVLALVLAGPDWQRQSEITAPPRATIRDRGPDHALDKIHEQQIADIRRRFAQTTAEHADLLKHVSRDLRTPLTAIMGFAETILGERFGPVGNERYRDYLSGIRNAGGRILALLDDLDRAPKADEIAAETNAKSADVDLNLIVQTCVTELQPDASRGRVLIRTSLRRPLPSIAADANAVRQIVLNLLTNSIKLAGAGGQVIISTGVSAAGTVSLRLRDTGTGVNESDVAAALQAQPLPGENADSSEGRLKLAVAKALLEANRASLKISSRPDDGTLVEVSFREVASPAA